MGTKSYLGYREGKNVIWVECLHDGYPTGVGKVLLKYYSDDERARWLCETGNELGCTINSIYDHEYDFYKGRFFKMFDTYITPASSDGWGRDHGTMDVRKYKEVSPYAYLFEKGRWLVKGYSKDTNGYKPSDWAPLEEVLSQGVVESRRYHGRMLHEGLGRDNYAVQFRDMHTAIPYLFTGTKEQMLKVDELLRSIENAESEEDEEILWNELNSMNIKDPFKFDSRKVEDDNSYYDWRTETSYKILNGDNRYDIYAAL